MAAVTITAGSVAPVAGARTRVMIAGGTITQGQPVYEDAADANKAKLADSNASAFTANACGIALTAAASGQAVIVQNGGDITIGGTLVAGTTYQVGAVAGSIVPNSDAATSGWFPGILGVAISTAVLRLSPLPSPTFSATAI